MTAVTAVTPTDSTATTDATATADAATATEPAAAGWGPPVGATPRVPPALAVGREAIRRPGELEAAVIAVAVDALWPRPVVVAPRPERHAAWRFSGRWWARPSPARRARPWL